jgi:hypothetical protein
MLCCVVVQPKTAAQYRERYARFKGWAQGHGWTGGHISAALALAYIQHKREVGKVNEVIMAVTAIKKAAAADGASWPADNVGVKQVMKALYDQAVKSKAPVKTDGLTTEMIKAYTRAGPAEGFKRRFEQDLVGATMLMRMGQQAVNATRLNLDDVTRGEGVVKVFMAPLKKNPQGAYFPVDFLPKNLEGARMGLCPAAGLLALKEARLHVGAQGSDPLFINTAGKRTSTRYWSDVTCRIAKAAEQAGVVAAGGKWGSKSFRTACLMELGYTEMQIRTLGVWGSDAMWAYMRKDLRARDGLTTKLFGISGHERVDGDAATGSVLRRVTMMSIDTRRYGDCDDQQCTTHT